MSELQKLLTETAAFAAPENVLEELSVEHVGARPGNVPHSLFEELWHLDFWQRKLLQKAKGESVDWPEHAAEGWPDESPDLEAWQPLKARFLSDLEVARHMAGDPERLSNSAGRTVPVRDVLEDLAVHNAYHFGRMVLLRQLLGVWPPPSGGDTW